MSNIFDLGATSLPKIHPVYETFKDHRNNPIIYNVSEPNENISIASDQVTTDESFASTFLNCIMIKDYCTLVTQIAQNFNKLVLKIDPNPSNPFNPIRNLVKVTIRESSAEQNPDQKITELFTMDIEAPKKLCKQIGSLKFLEFYCPEIFAYVAFINNGNENQIVQKEKKDLKFHENFQKSLETKMRVQPPFDSLDRNRWIQSEIDYYEEIPNFRDAKFLNELIELLEGPNYNLLIAMTPQLSKNNQIESVICRVINKKLEENLCFVLKIENQNNLKEAYSGTLYALSYLVAPKLYNKIKNAIKIRIKKKEELFENFSKLAEKNIETNNGPLSTIRMESEQFTSIDEEDVRMLLVKLKIIQNYEFEVSKLEIAPESMKYYILSKEKIEQEYGLDNFLNQLDAANRNSVFATVANAVTQKIFGTPIQINIETQSKTCSINNRQLFKVTVRHQNKKKAKSMVCLVFLILSVSWAFDSDFIK